jgi:ribosomal protein S1
LTPIPLHHGDDVDAVVTTVTPFGVLVQTDDGVPGLVRGARNAVGTPVHLHVLEYDDVQHRFSAELA